MYTTTTDYNIQNRPVTYLTGTIHRFDIIIIIHLLRRVTSCAPGCLRVNWWRRNSSGCAKTRAGTAGTGFSLNLDKIGTKHQSLSVYVTHIRTALPYGTCYLYVTTIVWRSAADNRQHASELPQTTDNWKYRITTNCPFSLCVVHMTLINISRYW